MKFLKRRFVVAFLFVVSFCLPNVVFAQFDPCPDPFVYCPIDDNVIILIAAIILLAAYKAFSLYRKVAVK